jgi:hypothetical protein
VDPAVFFLRRRKKKMIAPMSASPTMGPTTAPAIQAWLFFFGAGRGVELTIGRKVGSGEVGMAEVGMAGVEAGVDAESEDSEGDARRHVVSMLYD